MGSNIHIESRGDTEDIPEALAPKGDCTCYRFTDGRFFMYSLWADCEFIGTCNCEKTYGPDEHDYFCDRAGIARPKDFAKLREQTKELGSWVPILIDYLERNPEAWVSYS